MAHCTTKRQSKTRKNRQARIAAKARKKNNKTTCRLARRMSAKRKTASRKAARRQRHQNATRHGLIEAVGKWLPGQFFSRWKVVRGSKWSPHRVLWIAILMMWSAEQTLVERFDDARRTVRGLFPKWPLGTSYTGWYEAQAKWINKLRPALIKRLQEQMRQSWRKYREREGWCAFAVDGSRVECPRTKANKRVLGCAGRHKTGPQLFVTTLWHMGTGLPWDFRIGPGTASERRHLQAMLAELPAQSLVIGDAGFTGYDFYRAIVKAGHHFLLRVGNNVQLLRKLGYWEREGANTVYLWPSKQRRKEPIVLRLITLRRGNKKVYLVSNVLKPEALSEQSAGVLYEMRWGVEVYQPEYPSSAHLYQVAA